MKCVICEYKSSMANECAVIWNEVIEDGIAFPQLNCLDNVQADAFFKEQSFTAVAINEENDEIVGMYILHPNNVGRCGHIANTSYLVKKNLRGGKIGEALVIHSLEKAKELEFKIMQFNAVVKTNYPALKLYKKLGFIQIGTIPKGFLMKNGTYEDIILHYKVL